MVKTIEKELLEELQKDTKVDLRNYSRSSKIKINWICHKCGYRWRGAIRYRASQGSGCMRCKRIEAASKGEVDWKKINLSILRPDLWKYIENKKDLKLGHCASTKKAVLKCSNCGGRREVVASSLVRLRTSLCWNCERLRCQEEHAKKHPESLLKNSYKEIYSELESIEGEGVDFRKDLVSYGSIRMGVWKCRDCGNRFKRKVNLQVKAKYKCPCCKKVKTHLKDGIE